MPSQSRENTKNGIIWFPVDGEERILISTKNKINEAPSISNKRWNRQRRYTNGEKDTSVYFPLEGSYDNQNTKHQNTNYPSYVLPHNFHHSKNFIVLSSQSSENSKVWANRLGKYRKHAQPLNQEKDYFSATLEEYDDKKYTSNHYKPHQEFQPYVDVKNPNWPEHYPDAEHLERKFKKDVDPVNSNGPHNSNYFELPNKSGDFTFPNSYESNGFYNFGETQHQDQSDSFFNENINKPSANFILSSSTPEFSKYPSDSGQPSWTSTATGPGSFVFPGETARNTFSTTTATSTNTRRTTFSMDCERTCRITSEFNPVCGTDYETYSNIGKLKCAHKCGKDVHFYHYGSCGKSIFVTPLH